MSARRTEHRRKMNDRLDAARRQIAANPLAAVAGAAAVSAGLALLLPASRREIELTGEIADRLSEAARGAADAAIEAGKAEVQTLAQSALGGIGGAVVGQMIAAAGDQKTEAGSPSGTA